MSLTTCTWVGRESEASCCGDTAGPRFGGRGALKRMRDDAEPALCARWLRSNRDFICPVIVSGRYGQFIQFGHDGSLSHDPHRSMTHVAIGEVEQRGNGLDFETRGQRGMVVHVDFPNFHAGGLLRGNFV